MIDSWTTGTAAAAFLLYVLSFILRIRTARAAGLNSAARDLATQLEALAWLTLVVHVAFAFHEHHHWSHAAAKDHVAEETAATVGIRWGGGIYFNHLLLVVWGIAVARRWLRRPRTAPQPATLDRLIEGYVVLMWFSATVVFGSTGFRVLGIAGFAGIAAAIWLFRPGRHRQAPAASPQTQH